MATVKNSTPIRTALIYGVFGVLWILLSDTAMELFIPPDSNAHLWIQTIKGWLFVLISAGLIFLLLKKDMEFLLKSEENYRMLYASSLDAIMLTSPDGEILAVNPAGCRMFERTEEEIKRIGRSGIVDTSDPRLAIALEERARTGKFEGELTFIRRNGEKFPADVSSSVFKDGDGNLRTSMTLRDITERKRAEDRLHESEEKLQDVFNVMEEGMALNEFIFDEAGEIMDYRILEVNPAFERIAMLTREQVVGRTATDIYQMSSEFINDFWKKNLGSSQPIKAEYYMPQINKWRHISTSQPLNNKFATVFIDTTEQKMAELALRESETNLRAIWENSTQSYMLIDPDRRVQKMNHVAIELEQGIFGRVTQPGDSIYDIVRPQERDWFDETFEKAMAGEVLQFERSFYKGGIQHWYEYRLSPVRTDNGENLGIFLVTTDITERKQAEEKLKQQATWSGYISDAVISTDLNMNIASWNTAAEQIYGWTEQETIGKSIDELLQTKFLSCTIEEARNALRENGLWQGQLEQTTRSGQRVEIEACVNYLRDHHGRITGGITVNRDVTARKQAEAGLQTQTERLNLATRSAHIGIWDWDIQNNKLEWDDQMFKLYGIGPEQFPQAYEAWLNGVHPDDREFSDEVVRKALSGEIEFDTEFRVVWPDGSVHWLKADGQVFRDPNGKATRMVGLNYEITERILAEEKIREKDIQFRKLSANVPDLIYQFTRRPDGTYHVPIASEGIRNIFGCTAKDVVNDFAPIARVIYPEDSERVIHDIEFSAKNLTFFTCDFRVQIPGKEGLQWISSRSTPEKLPDGSVTWYGFNANITERKLAEVALRSSEENLAEAQRMAHIGSWEWDMLANTVTWSKEMYRVFDVEPEAFNGKPEFLLTLIHPDDVEKITNSINDNLEDGSSPTMEYRVVHKDGSIRHVLADGRVKFNEAGKPIKSIGTVQDITEHKQAEEALRASELRFRSISENSLAGIYIVQNGKLSYLNPALAEIFKYDPQELLGVDALILIHPDDRALVSENIRRRIAGEVESLRYEFRGLCKNGEIKTIEALGVRVDLEGQPAIIGNIVDITERKQAEALLQESEFKYRALVDNMQVGIVAHAADTKILFFNPMASQLLGLSSDQMQGKTAVDPSWHFIGEDGNQLPLENYPVYQGLRSNSPVTNIILGIVHPDVETTTWAQCNVHQISDRTGQTNQIIVTFIDITERKRAEKLIRQYTLELEKRVQERTAEVQDLYNNAPAGYHSLNAKGLIVQINQTELDWLGYTREELVGVKSYAELFTAESKQFFSEQFPIFLKRGWIKDLEFDVIRKDGSILPILVNATAIYDESGSIVMSRSSIFDITKRKQAELELQAANIALEKASKLKDEFLANMSHELRTPLNSIMGFSEILLEGVRGPINENQKQAVQMIRVSGEHLLGLINNILDVSRIEAGKFELHTEIIQVNEVCQKSLNYIKQLANKKSITVEYASSPPAAVISADPIRLKQILVNLLNNAVKFTPEKGTVKLQVQADAQAGLMHFSVIDTGVGIAPSDLDRLFQPFVQLDSSLSRQHEGSGLGLSLVKKMVELHGGSVEVQSEVNEGSRFTFSLPWNPTQDNDQQALLDGEGSTLTKSEKPSRFGKILIADDNEVNVMMLQDYLENIGHQVFVAHHGGEVLPKTEEVHPDIILMDLQMPHVNGFEATRRIKTDPRFASVPIIALTAFAMSGDRERCLEAGMDEYISKPFKLKEINEMIERFLSQHST